MEYLTFERQQKGGNTEGNSACHAAYIYTHARIGQLPSYKFDYSRPSFYAYPYECVPSSDGLL